MGSSVLDGLLWRDELFSLSVSSGETHSFLRGNCQFPYWKLIACYGHCVENCRYDVIKDVCIAIMASRRSVKIRCLMAVIVFIDCKSTHFSRF